MSVTFDNLVISGPTQKMDEASYFLSTRSMKIMIIHYDLFDMDREYTSETCTRKLATEL